MFDALSFRNKILMLLIELAFLAFVEQSILELSKFIFCSNFEQCANNTRVYFSHIVWCSRSSIGVMTLLISKLIKSTLFLISKLTYPTLALTLSCWGTGCDYRLTPLSFSGTGPKGSKCKILLPGNHTFRKSLVR